MSDRVWMSHPELPDSPPIQVGRLQVPHYAAAGWVETDAPAAPARPVPAKAASAPESSGEPQAPEPTPEPDSPKRRRSTSDKEATPS
ncbi:hypothetical protein [Streptomyces sp. NPDC020983]|uniref:hypothetical protein n=1 Tax=Streptomyces sp. NPDC020983 TaxID=3365106 RepID=UPI0037A57016